MNIRMQGYQQAHKVNEPKDKMMWGYEVTNKHTQAWRYEDAGMEVWVHESEDLKI